MTKPLSILLDRFLNPYIRESYSKFSTFIQKYLEYAEQDGKYQQLLSDFLHYIDIDKIDEDDPYSSDSEILELYIKQYLSSFPLYRINDINIKKLIKNAKDFYSCKGTERSYDFIFRLMNHAGAFSFYYPDQDILIANDTVNGVLSDEKALHDNYYRAFYTYEIRSDMYGYAELKDIIENMLHPVGCKVFFKRSIISEVEDPYSPTTENYFSFVLAMESTEWIEYKTVEDFLGGLIFEDLENGNAGMIAEMTFEDFGFTFDDLENATYSSDYFPHQLHVYRQII